MNLSNTFLTTQMLMGSKGLRGQYDFDDDDDYITIPTVTLAVGDYFEFEFSSTVTSTTIFGRILSQSPTETSAVYYNQSQVKKTGSSWSITVDGLDTSVLPNDGVSRLVRATAIEPITVNLLGASASFASNAFLDGVIKNLSLVRISPTASEPDLFYPMDDGWINNPVIRQTLSTDVNMDGVAFNFDESGWTYA